MPIPNLPAVNQPDLTVNSPSDVQEHLDVAKKKIDTMRMKKSMGYKQLEEMRQTAVAKLLDALRAQGIDVSSPEKLQQFIMMVAQKDPDLAQGLQSALAQLLPDNHEAEHAAGKGLADYLFRGSLTPQQGPSAQPPAAPPSPESVPPATAA